MGSISGGLGKVSIGGGLSIAWAKIDMGHINFGTWHLTAVRQIILICHGSATPISMILSSASLQISRFSGFIIIIACPNLRFLPCLSLSLYLFMCVIARLIIVLQLLLLSNSAWRTIVMWAQMWNCMIDPSFECAIWLGIQLPLRMGEPCATVLCLQSRKNQRLLNLQSLTGALRDFYFFRIKRFYFAHVTWSFINGDANIQPACGSRCGTLKTE